MPLTLGSFTHTGTTKHQQTLWEDTLDDRISTERDARRGSIESIKLNDKLMHEIQMLIARLVEKAPQLLGNFTTNLAESWMHIRSKFDGGKVVNRSQSGSWQYRCMGAGLQQNLGKSWAPKLWSEMTASNASKVFVNATKSASKIAESNKQRKATEIVKERRRKANVGKENTQQAWKAYNRYNNGCYPDDIVDDVSPCYLQQLMDGFYTTKVTVTAEEANEIEQQTRDQHASASWERERKIRITASKAGPLAKMRKTTKRSKKVEELLYSRFRGNQATRYGTLMENTSRQEYQIHQNQQGHKLTTLRTGLMVSSENPWLAASPDDQVFDEESSPQWGLAEYKNPYSVRHLTIKEACKVSSFCLERKEDKYCLKKGHDYYYQVQCQLYCCDREWCDFVVRTEKELHVERILRNTGWWNTQLEKLKAFYFQALLPELACPRYHKGGIRD